MILRKQPRWLLMTIYLSLTLMVCVEVLFCMKDTNNPLIEQWGQMGWLTTAVLMYVLKVGAFLLLSIFQHLLCLRCLHHKVAAYSVEVVKIILVVVTFCMFDVPNLGLLSWGDIWVFLRAIMLVCVVFDDFCFIAYHGKL